jgi:hypothetical protein
MIDLAGCIGNVLSNIIGTVARANPKPKFDVASVAFICFPAAAGFSSFL